MDFNYNRSRSWSDFSRSLNGMEWSGAYELFYVMAISNSLAKVRYGGRNGFENERLKGRKSVE